MPPDFYIRAVRIDVVEHSALGDRAAMFTLNLSASASADEFSPANCAQRQR